MLRVSATAPRAVTAAVGDRQLDGANCCSHGHGFCRPHERARDFSIRFPPVVRQFVDVHPRVLKAISTSDLDLYRLESGIDEEPPVLVDIQGAGDASDP